MIPVTFAGLGLLWAIKCSNFVCLSFLSLTTSLQLEDDPCLHIKSNNVQYIARLVVYLFPVANNCENMSLKCYMLELIMVLDEEEIEDQATKCIISFNEFLQPPNVSSDGCPACETYSLKNTSTFLDRLKTLLEKMNAQRNINRNTH
uniref:Interleukin n=1 Tax=Anabas testudineus TaxID=64144 RepID=A0AAQ6ISW2_ANATE